MKNTCQPLILQFTGLSGSGKTTLATHIKESLKKTGLNVMIVDGDEYRKTLCKDLGFSRKDRMENIRRLGKVAASSNSPIVIIAAINPFEEVRQELKEKYGAPLIWIDCKMEMLIERDTKGLYKRAFLNSGHPLYLNNLTGVNDQFEMPTSPDLIIDTAKSEIKDCVDSLLAYIKNNLGTQIKGSNSGQA